jgi:hypothetical protein
MIKRLNMNEAEALNNGNEYAAPISHHDAGMGLGGLSKREHFAAMAMQGLLSDGAWCERVSAANESEDEARLAVGIAAVAMADALLLALTGRRP